MVVTPPPPVPQVPPIPVPPATAIVRAPKPSLFIVDPIFPKNELILIGGPAQSGKTSLLFQIIIDWSNSRKVFGHPSHPAPYCFVSCNQSLAACRSALARSGNNDPYMPMVSMIDANGGERINKKLTFEEVCSEARSINPDIEVIFLDGILSLCPGSLIDNSGVAEFLAKTIHTLQQYQLTLIAAGRSAKPKEATNGSRNIDKFLGATAWTEYAETFIAIDNPKSKDPRDTHRTVTIMSKRAKAEVLQYRFSDAGNLVEVPSENDAPEPIETFKACCSVPGDEFKSSELVEIAEGSGMSRPAFYRHLKLLLDQGYLEPIKEKDGRQIKEGYYRVPYAN